MQEESSRCLPQLEKSPCSSEDRVQPQINKYSKNYKKLNEKARNKSNLSLTNNSFSRIIRRIKNVKNQGT